MKSLNVALIGTGYMGKCHAIAWNAVKTVYGDVARPMLATLCEVSEDLARERAAAFGFARATSDWRSIVEDPAIDVVSITTPNRFHAEMAIAALDAGKHVWCEKPMAPSLDDAVRMQDAAARSGRVALLGYNYIQNPAVRHMKKIIDDGVIGAVHHVRIEMDEDFMADAQAPMSWRSEKASGYGALDDFAVHPLSLLWTLFGGATHVFGDMTRPYATRPSPSGPIAVENWDCATALLRFPGNINASILVSRAAWGRKGRIAVQIFGSNGTLAFDQERFNEVQLFVRDGAEENQGFRTILMAPAHQPYGIFTPGAGHQLGFNDLKTIECRALIGLIAGEQRLAITFTDGGLQIERTVHAIARAAQEGHWVEV
ncbi:Gfo/Idh/MocA family protein [Methylovirgula sp. 4M-Z18]|uniref:Gfo/Idh/MocA family protein n=1 Tax=Methylovirgula sp. 4M-Z18 TaxID=2293567 RepID=UPI000E2FC699|nr:Gfo/Idh/MocA family oxidoreductase [Methylovirgula sp. 4M-Z18]RFB78501.1 gfo/Idh/MocA family oxidoreductase [Methylovirgula sp. 4M-Z18]